MLAKKYLIGKAKMDLSFCTALLLEKLKFTNAFMELSSKYFKIRTDLLLFTVSHFSLVLIVFSDKS